MHLLDTVFWLTSFMRTWMLLIKTVLIYIDYFWQIDIIDYFWQIGIKLHVHSIKTTINYFIFKLKKSWHWWNWKLQDKIRYNVLNNVQRLLPIFNFFFSIQAKFFKWCPHEPNDFGQGENCVEYKNKCFNDERCTTALKYICSKPPRMYQ
jgi:hypothetical protein